MFLFVCLFFSHDYAKYTLPIFTKFVDKVAYGTQKTLDFGW